MRTYEVMIILPESLTDDKIDLALKEFVKEAKSFKARCSAPSRMGRKIFARPQQKMTAGEYALCGMEMDPANIKPFRDRLKFHEDIFRVMFTLKAGVKESASAPAPTPAS